MDDDYEDRLRSIIGNLDESVPREGSWIHLAQYGGGPDEGQMSGNRNGYRRLGIEFLKASLDDDSEEAFHVDYEYLVAPGSTIFFDWFELSDAPPEAVPSPWFDRIVAITCLTVLVLGSIVFVIGISTIVHWLIK